MGSPFLQCFLSFLLSPLPSPSHGPFFFEYGRVQFEPLACSHSFTRSLIYITRLSHSFLLSIMGILERINDIEKEIGRTQKNKGRKEHVSFLTDSICLSH